MQLRYMDRTRDFDRGSELSREMGNLKAKQARRVITYIGYGYMAKLTLMYVCHASKVTSGIRFMGEIKQLIEPTPGLWMSLLDPMPSTRGHVSEMDMASRNFNYLEVWPRWRQRLYLEAREELMRVAQDMQSIGVNLQHGTRVSYRIF